MLEYKLLELPTLIGGGESKCLSYPIIHATFTASHYQCYQNCCCVQNWRLPIYIYIVYNFCFLLFRYILALELLKQKDMVIFHLISSLWMSNKGLFVQHVQLVIIYYFGDVYICIVYMSCFYVWVCMYLVPYCWMIYEMMCRTVSILLLENVLYFGWNVQIFGYYFQ